MANGEGEGGRVKMAYADPPYIGQAKRHYDEPEVDHEVLIAEMLDNFPDGWALSCTSPSLHDLIPMVPRECRIMAWVKPFCSFKPGVNPAYAWEPVIVYGGRKMGKEEDTVRDWVACNITLRKGLSGVKAFGFSFWLFEVLNLLRDDEFVDLFPGSGAVSMAWDAWCARPMQGELLGYEKEAHQG